MQQSVWLAATPLARPPANPYRLIKYEARLIWSLAYGVLVLLYDIVITAFT